MKLYSITHTLPHPHTHTHIHKQFKKTFAYFCVVSFSAHLIFFGHSQVHLATTCQDMETTVLSRDLPYLNNKAEHAVNLNFALH